LRGRADELGKHDAAAADRTGADRAATSQDAAGLQFSDRPGRAGAASRDALLLRLEDLPPNHPSSIGAGRSRDRSTQTSQEDAGGCAAPADKGDAPPPQDRRPAVAFMDRVEHFESLWKAHLERWPEPADSDSDADRTRPDGPPGSWRGTGDRYLSPGQNAETDRMVELLRKPEKAVTELLLKIQQDNPYGGYLVGLDHRLKGEDRLKEKMTDKMGVKVDASPADAAGTINDAVRYTFCFGHDEYVRGHGDVRRQLELAGYKRTYSRNHWLDNPQYKGVNSRWEAPDGGRFELQFHTPESFYAKERLTHSSYKRLRSPGTSRAEERALMVFQNQVSAAVPQPSEVWRILDYQVRT
jgi:hypothetical protein